MFGQVESFKVFDLRIVSCLIELRAVNLVMIIVRYLIELRAVCSLFGELKGVWLSWELQGV